MHAEVLIHAQQEHARRGNQGPRPRLPTDPLLPAHEHHHGHQDNIQPGEKARIAGRGPLHACLLTDRGPHQQAPGDRRPAEKGLRRHAEGPHPAEQDHRPQQEAQAVEEKGPQVGGRHALRHEGAAPQQGRQEQQRIGTESQASVVIQADGYLWFTLEYRPGTMYLVGGVLREYRLKPGLQRHAVFYRASSKAKLLTTVLGPHVIS